MAGIRIDDLPSTVNPSQDHEFPAMKDGVTVKLTVGQVVGMTASAMHAADEKVAPADADELPLVDSAASWGLKKLTWANIKAALKAYFDTLYLSLSGGTMGTGAVITFAAGAGDKIHLSGSGYGIGVESSTINYWANSTHRFRGASNNAGTILAEIVATPTQPQHLTPKSYVDAQVATKIGVYTGATQNETAFPVGHIVCAVGGADPVRNGTGDVRLSATTSDYTIGGAEAALAGTWRSRGRTSTSNKIMQRTA